jgi:hypothetical protein
MSGDAALASVFTWILVSDMMYTHQNDRKRSQTVRMRERSSSGTPLG